MNNSHPKITDIFPIPVVLAMYWLMQNGNPPLHYIMAFRDKGQVFYRMAKTILVKQAIIWTLNTILGKTKPGKEFTVVPLSKNDRNESTWAVFDCDDHTAGSPNAIKIGDRLLAAMKKVAPETQYVYERSGRGMHLFFFWNQLRPCAE